MIKNQVKHKSETGRFYKGIPIHAAEGLHQYVFKSIRAIFPENEHILELGAGSGAMTARLFDNGYRVTAVDLNRTTWLCNDADILELDLNQENWSEKIQKKKYRLIIAVELIEHLENPKLFLRQLYELTQQGGFCIVTTPNVLCADSVNQMLRKGSFFGFNRYEYFNSGHMSIIPIWLLEIFSEEAGFTVYDKAFVGRMDKHRFKASFLRLFAWFIQNLRRTDNIRREDDGIISVLVLQKKIRV